MTVRHTIRAFAGTFVLISLAVGTQGSPLFVSVNWLWLAVFVGANLLQSAFTRFCLLEKLLVRAGVPDR